MPGTCEGTGASNAVRELVPEELGTGALEELVPKELGTGARNV